MNEIIPVIKRGNIGNKQVIEFKFARAGITVGAVRINRQVYLVKATQAAAHVKSRCDQQVGSLYLYAVDQLFGKERILPRIL